jgi:23S rRNA pseudouridine2605 synthase
MERWIEQGRLGIDGRPAKLGDRVLEGQRIEVDGRPWSAGRRRDTLPAVQQARRGGVLAQGP